MQKMHSSFHHLLIYLIIYSVLPFVEVASCSLVMKGGDHFWNAGTAAVLVMDGLLLSFSNKDLGKWTLQSAPYQAMMGIPSLIGPLLPN